MRMDKSKDALLNANFSFEEEPTPPAKPAVKKEEEAAKPVAPKAKTTAPTSETVEDEDRKDNN